MIKQKYMEKDLQSMVFNTNLKEVKFYNGIPERSTLVKVYDNVPTVRENNGYYEVIQMTTGGSRKPVLRVPISNTNMFIED